MALVEASGRYPTKQKARIKPGGISYFKEGIEYVIRWIEDPNSILARPKNIKREPFYIGLHGDSMDAEFYIDRMEMFGKHYLFISNTDGSNISRGAWSYFFRKFDWNFLAEKIKEQ